MHVIMVVIVAMCMGVIMRILHLKTTRARAERVTMNAVFDIGAGSARTLPFDVVVMAFLRRTNLGLKPKNLRAVFAHRAVHEVFAAKNFRNPLREGRYYLRMIVQIPRFDELNIRVLRRNFVGKTIDAVNQNSREQEVREDDDTLESKLRYALQTRFNQRKSHTGIPGLRPTKTHAFPEHPGDLGDVGVCIGITRTPPNNNETRLMQR